MARFDSPKNSIYSRPGIRPGRGTNNKGEGPFGLVARRSIPPARFHQRERQQGQIRNELAKKERDRNVRDGSRSCTKHAQGSHTRLQVRVTHSLRSLSRHGKGGREGESSEDREFHGREDTKIREDRRRGKGGYQRRGHLCRGHRPEISQSDSSQHSR